MSTAIGNSKCSVPRKHGGHVHTHGSAQRIEVLRRLGDYAISPISQSPTDQSPLSLGTKMCEQSIIFIIFLNKLGDGTAP